MAAPSKLMLCVIDAMAPEMLMRTVAQGGAPVLGALIERGVYVPDCIAAFPSVTPVCAASIVTGAGQDAHLIPGMNWYHREEGRYVEYGSSFRSSQRFGIARQLIDTVYNMNRAHLAPEPLTLFERLDDAGVRTAGTTYLMYRGRHLHEPRRDTALSKLAAATLMRHPVLGPRELFYADIFASRATPCRSVLGMPGVRDRHSGCVGAHLVENDLFDFMLLSLPDNDWLSHKQGPEAQVHSIAAADAQLARVMEPAGGLDGFLEDCAVIVMADHSQAPVTGAVALQQELAADHSVLGPGRRAGGGSGGEGGDGGGGGGRSGGGGGDRGAQIAVCPSQRAAMVYVLEEEERDGLRPALVRDCLRADGVELAAWLQRDGAGLLREGAIRGRDGAELRFAPGGDLRDLRGGRWSVEGDLGLIGGEVHDGLLLTPTHPEALARVHEALTCPTSGDVILSAAPGFEFADWGGQAHVGGGSHGSLRAEDSLCPLIACGLPEAAMAALAERSVEAPGPSHRIGDVAPMVCELFGV